MGLSLANRTRLWQEQSSGDPPIDAIGLDWGLYRAGPLVEADILTPISSRYNGDLDAAPRRGASLHKKMLPIKMSIDPWLEAVTRNTFHLLDLHCTAACWQAVSGSYWCFVTTLARDERRNPQWSGDHFLLSALFGQVIRFLRGGARYNASCMHNYSFPFHSGIPRRRWRSIA
jgi:hypothetical protein